MRDRVKLVFVLSHACPLKCNFCCSTREVVGRGRIQRDTIRDSMLNFACEPSVSAFGFTGGDPFLYLEDIKAAVREARDYGVTQPIQMTTSAYWAESREQVTALLAELQALGLDQLMLSYDHEHARWVTPDQIRMVCEAAAKLGIRIVISATFWNEGEQLADLLPDVAAAPGITTINHVVTPMGRAKTSSAWPRRYNVPVQAKMSCFMPGEYLFSVYPDGEVYPCCGGGFQIEAGLSCGNINRDPPARILYAGLANFHVRLAKEFGWGVLYALIEREAPELAAQLPSIENADSVCEICRDLHLKLAEQLAPYQQVIEREYARARATREWQRAGGPERRAIPGGEVTLDELLARMDCDRALRLDYLAGIFQLGDDFPAEPPREEPSNIRTASFA